MTTSNSTSRRSNLSFATTARDAALIAAGCAVVALVVNALRPDGIALVQHEAYDILVPCPEPVGDAKPLEASSPLVRDPKSLLLDVRSKQEFAHWHLPRAINQPFDWLGPPVDAEVERVAKKVAASGAQRVVVYGDGDDPDSGKEWAKLLSGARIKNVLYVEGGAPAINPQLPKPSEDDDDEDDDEADPENEPQDAPAAIDSAASSTLCNGSPCASASSSAAVHREVKP